MKDEHPEATTKAKKDAEGLKKKKTAKKVSIVKQEGNHHITRKSHFKMIPYF